MAEARRNWIRWFLLGALCLSAHALILAQSNPADSPREHFAQVQSAQSGSLAGRLTDLHSAALAGVSIVLRNQSTGAEVRATTARNGAFRFAALDAGEYTLDADAAQLGHGRLEGILVSGGLESRIQAALNFEPVAPGLLEATAPAQTAAPPTVAAHLPLNVSMPLAAEQTLALSATTVAPATPPAQFRPSLSTSTPQLIASITGESLNLLPLAVSAAPDSIGISVPPPTSTPIPPLRSPLPAAAPKQTPAAGAASASPSARPESSALQRAQTPAHLFSLPSRAALETQSAPMELALFLAQPNVFPLKAGPAPALAAIAEPPNLVQAAMLNPLSAATAAAEQPSEPVASAVSTTVSASQLQALPASGRRWQEFLLDTPAASASAGSSQTSYRGSQQSAEVTVDGANIGLAFGVSAASGPHSSNATGEESDPENSKNQSSSQTWTGGHGLGVSEAAVREVTTVAGNVEAEGMRSAGGRVTIHTDSGSNALHGQGFLFDRQNNWGARNPFTQWVTETAPANLTYNPSGPALSVPVFGNGPSGSPESYTPPDHELVGGIGVGSDIRRNKLFWFAALDSYHRNDPGLAMLKHPYLQPPSGCATLPCTSTTTTGFFATPSDGQLQLLSAQLDLSSANPMVEGLTAYSQMLETLAGLLGPAPRTAAQWVGFGRFDWQAAERDHLTLEGIGTNWNSPGGGLTGVSANYGNHSFGSSQATQQWFLARWEAYLTPNLLAVTQASAGRAVLSAKPDTPSAFEKTFLAANAYGQLPQIVVDSRYGFTVGNPSRFGQGDYPDERPIHGQEMLDWVHDKLLIKAGFELDHDADAISLLRNQTGTYTYSKVQNFISDALAFEEFGLTNLLNPKNPHNCDPTGKPWYASNGQLMGLGALPCYSHYSQMIGPTNWNLSTNDWAGYATAQWQPNKLAVFSVGLRWEREQMPPPLAALANPELPLTAKLPDLGNNWGPRVSLAIGKTKGHWPVLRLGYGMYYGRTENATIETALTQTGSLNGDLSYFIRPTDGFLTINGTSAAPPFPYVLTGSPSSVVKPGAVAFAPNFRNPEVHQAVAAIEQPLPGRVELTASMMLSLGRRLPVFIDTNLAPPLANSQLQPQTIMYDVCDEIPPTPSGSSNTNGRCGNLGLGPIKAAQITVPFYASTASTGVVGWLNQDYQQVNSIESKANSTYEAAMVKLTRYGSRGLSVHAHYTYAHAMDWNPDESPLNPVDASSDFSQEYGTSNLDVRHSAAAMVVFETPWKLRRLSGRIVNGWMISGIGQFHSGLPYTMRTSGSLPEELNSAGYPIVGLGPSMNGSGGDNRVYGTGSDGLSYNIGRNTFRYPSTWKADLRLAKRFDLGEMRDLEILAETFNLFNHENVTEVETTGYTIESGSPPSTLGASGTPPTLNFLTGLKSSSTTGLATPGFGQPLDINATDFYRERQIQLGLRMRF